MAPNTIFGNHISLSHLGMLSPIIETFVPIFGSKCHLARVPRIPQVRLQYPKGVWYNQNARHLGSFALGGFTGVPWLLCSVRHRSANSRPSPARAHER